MRPHRGWLAGLLLLGFIAVGVAVGTRLASRDPRPPTRQEPKVYRLSGVFSVDESPDPGRDGLSSAVMQLSVERWEVVERPAMPGFPVTGKDSRALTWRMIEDGYQGAYGIGSPLKALLNKRVHITGVVYDRCGGGLYLRAEQDADANCILPDAPTHLELVDDQQRPLTRLPAK